MPHSKNLSYDFGLFRFDVSLRVLTKAGEVISLGDKAAEVLLFLLHNAGNLVGKEDLMKEVWPNSFVEESNLTQNIHTLRRVLGDDRVSARYIETVPRRGYRFVAEVRQSETGSHFSRTNESAEAGDGQDSPPPKLGVLPFVNATGSDGFEYLAEGISENIINNLSRISKLRVMSRSFMFRYKGTAIEAKKIAFEMKLDAMLVGKIISRPSGMTISAELVDGNGFMLWGDSFDCELKDILEIQDEIARQISAALRLKLTGEEEKRITTRYTENSEAYQAYMEARFHWSRYTRTEIEQAIEHFRAAIELDPNYALAYSGIVDCYLRLATNYLPPENYLRHFGELEHREIANGDWWSGIEPQSSDSKLRLRHEWDWKGAEREIRRANELMTDYPAAHQWKVAHLRAQQWAVSNRPERRTVSTIDTEQRRPATLIAGTLTPSEQVQVFCTIAREQIAVGNYEGAKLIIGSWLPGFGWPRLDKLNSHTAADLLFTLGTLIGYVSSTGQISRGQKRAESFLNGAIAILEQLNSRVRAAETRIELARCYFRQGFFDEAREALKLALSDLPEDEAELKSLCLILFGAVERDSGRLAESLSRLQEAATLGTSGQLITGRYHHELAITLKELAISDGKEESYYQAARHFRHALNECEAIGNHRHMAAVENNLGYLLLHLARFAECEVHLTNALNLFSSFADHVRAAQVQETLTQFYLAVNKIPEAQNAITEAVETFERTDGGALLAEALITKGVVASRQQRFTEARACFEGANRVAERTGDCEGTRRGLMTMYEEMGSRLSRDEATELGRRLRRLMSQTSPGAIRSRMEVVLVKIENDEAGSPARG